MEIQGKKRIAVIAVIVVLLAAAAGGIVYVVWDSVRLRRMEDAYEELRTTEPETAVAEAAEETEELIYCSAVYDFAALKEENEDIYAWLNVPGTDVDYPVLQSDTDNYYLDYNLDHSEGRPGCIYTNQCNSRDFSDYNTVLYGHNMKNGTMFGTLHRFDDGEFFEENDTILIYTEECRLTYEIYAAVKFSDAYIPAYFDVASADGNEQFLLAALSYGDEEISHVREGMEVVPEDQLITLSTCVRGETDTRYLVIGKLVEVAWYSEQGI